MKALWIPLRRINWLPLYYNRMQRHSMRPLNVSSALFNKQIEPLLPEKSGDDQFNEMMDDRTNALLRSLGIDASQFEQKKKAPVPNKLKEGGENDSASASAKEETSKSATPQNEGVDLDIDKNKTPAVHDINVPESDATLESQKANAQAGSAPANETTVNETNENENSTTLPPSPAIPTKLEVSKNKKAPVIGYYIDSQDIYAELRAAGLATGQAEVLMRTIQELINELVITCKQRAVPVSAAANEAYLFDAASSEMRNEITNSRQSQATSYRSGLARLQRDVEILEHTATEMTNLLKSDMDIEVHERKNSARAEENIIQLKIQDLSNKISTRLNSELKSEIENLRWQITRRSLISIGLVAALFIWITQTSSSKKTAMSQERQRNTSGKPVPVHILAPSMSAGDEASYETVVPPHVDDINALSANSHELSSNDASNESNDESEKVSTDTNNLSITGDK